MASDFGEAVVAAYERMPLWQRDQFDAAMREAVEAIKRIAAWAAEHEAEWAALTATEDDA